MLLEQGPEDKLIGKRQPSPIVASSIFALYVCNYGPVYGTDIALSVVAIIIELPFPIDLSSARSRWGTLEVKQALGHF